MYAASNKLMGLILLFILTACSSGGGGGGNNDNGNTDSPAITIWDSVVPNDDFQVPFGSVTANSTLDKTVKITNDGTADLVLDTIADIDALAVPFSVSADNCSGQALAPAASCTVTIQFAPTSAGSFTDSFDIPSNDTGSASVTISLSGTGTADSVPNITVTDSVSPNDDLQVTFGHITVNTTTDETVTVTNDGTAALSVGSIGGTDALASPFSIGADNCSGQSLSPGANCTISIQFAPDAAGDFNDSFDIPSNDPDIATTTVSVSGSGDLAAGPNISVTDTVPPNDDLQVPFGDATINDTSDRTVTITNDGTADLVLGSITVADALTTPFSITTDNCSGQSLAPAASCIFTIRFAPVSVGTFNGSVEIPSNDPDQASVIISVSGTGNPVPIPDIAISDSVSPPDDLQIPFGNVTANSTADQTVTITNNGGAALVLGDIGTSNPLAAPFSVINDNCFGQSLAPGEVCQLTVHFAPTAVGTFSDSFDIPSNDPDQASITINVNGTGDPVPVPDITITDAAAPNDDLQLPFANVTVGNTSDSVVTITNDGTADLVMGTIGNTNGLNAPFSILSDGCSGQTLVVGEVCTLTIRFAPTTTGVFTDSFNVPSNDPDESDVTISVSGTGDPVPAPVLTVSPTLISVTACYTPASIATRTVTIENTGNADLFITGMSITGTYFGTSNNNCPQSPNSLAPSASCTVDVVFAPLTRITSNGTLTITTGDAQQADVSLTGNGINCVL